LDKEGQSNQNDFDTLNHILGNKTKNPKQDSPGFL